METKQENRLLSSYALGSYQLKNRIVMPAMTRSRAGEAEVPTELMAAYYGQRSSAGLIISEGTQISQQGQGYAWTPGIFSQEQIEGWKKITEAVHHNGGVIFAQLWHVGRLSHRTLQPGGGDPVAPSAIRATGIHVYIDEEGQGAATGKATRVPASQPRALSLSEINGIIEDFACAAQNAMAAGFDGVEIHGANGYLIQQFLHTGTNLRTDEYGGSLVNRLRFLKQVTEAVSARVGKQKVGVRLSPLTTLQGAVDACPEETYVAAAVLLQELGVLYLHIAEADWEDAPVMSLSFKEGIRNAFSHTLIYTGKYTKEKATRAVSEGWADLIGFGRPFLANPDLPWRLKNDLPLNEVDPTTFFGGGDHGYTDYPFFQSSPSVGNKQKKTALIVGAQGVIGRNLADHLSTLADWEIIGLSRRKGEPSDRIGSIAADLMDAEDVLQKLREVPQVSHVFYTAYQDRPTWAELVEPNMTMLRHIVTAIQQTAPGLEHISLMQGYKVYGAHLGPFKTPAREEDAGKHMPPEFNVDQQQLLERAQKGKAWTWSAIRPSVVSGFAVGNPMNLALVIAIYASICKELGIPLRFPGKPGAYDTLMEVTDAGLLARATVWAATEPRCANQAFNINNGDLFRWRELWPRIAAYFGLEVMPPLPLSLKTVMGDKEPLWQQMQKKYDLAYRYEEVSSWAFGDFVFSWDYDFFADGTKARRLGFHDYVQTEEMFYQIFDELKKRKVIPG